MRSTDRSSRTIGEPVLRIENLDVHYGQAHALQGVALTLAEGVLAVVGRNGMGKSTLCKAVTGLVSASGTIRFDGQGLVGRSPDEITRMGVAYVPQGRRVWRSLTVDETLQLASKTARQGAWTVDRVYQVFPRLAERRANGGAQLSGGEQQMLAIARALLFNPRLLVMDEPTEGLAPVVVEQVASLLKTLARDRSMSVLLIEQNLGVALEVADDVAVMVNGRIAHCVPAAELAADRALQQRLLGLKTGAADATVDAEEEEATAASGPATIFRVLRAHAPVRDLPEPAPCDREPEPPAELAALVAAPEAVGEDASPSDAPRDRPVYLAGAWNRHQRELACAKRCLEQLGARVVTVELAGGSVSSAQVGPRDVLRHHPDPRVLARFAGGVADGQDVAVAFAAFVAARQDLGALLVVTHEATAAAAMAGAQAVPAAVPALLVSNQPLRAARAGVLTMTAPLGAADGSADGFLRQAAAAVAAMLRAAPAPGISTPSQRDRAASAPSRLVFH